MEMAREVYLPKTTLFESGEETVSPKILPFRAKFSEPGDQSSIDHLNGERHCTIIDFRAAVALWTVRNLGPMAENRHGPFFIGKP